MFIQIEHLSNRHEDYSYCSPSSSYAENKSCSILSTTPLPTLNIDLLNRLARDGIFKSQKYFISFWGAYLWTTTNTKPTKFDYNNIAQSIVQAYPALKGGSDDCVSNIICLNKLY